MPVAQNTLKAQRQSPGHMLVVNKHGPVRPGRSSQRDLFILFNMFCLHVFNVFVMFLFPI